MTTKKKEHTNALGLREAFDDSNYLASVFKCIILLYSCIALSAQTYQYYCFLCTFVLVGLINSESVSVTTLSFQLLLCG